MVKSETISLRMHTRGQLEKCGLIKKVIQNFEYRKERLYRLKKTQLITLLKQNSCVFAEILYNTSVKSKTTVMWCRKARGSLKMEIASCRRYY